MLWNGEKKCCPFFRHTFYPDTPFLLLCDFCCQIESQPHPWPPLLAGIIHARERLKNAGLLALRDTLPMVLYTYGHLLRITHGSHLDWFLRWCIFDGVRQEITEHLSSAHAISVDLHVGFLRKN